MKFLTLIVILTTLSQWHCQSYDYLLLVQEVAGTACLQKTCTSSYIGNMPQAGVNMHGLWPNYNNGSWPSFCGSLATDAYSDSKISSSVLTQLNSAWVGLYSSTSDFRNHEWEKHGSCFINDAPSNMKFLGQTNLDSPMNTFFSTVMQIYSAINLESVLFNSTQNSDGSGVQWQESDLFSTLESYLGVSVFNFNCDNNNNLYTINICLDPNLNIIDCPNTSGFKKNCYSHQPINVPYLSSSS